MRLIYDILFFIYALLYLPYLLLSRRWYPGFGLRFGFFPRALKEDLGKAENIWVHAVSVGEVAAAAVIIRGLKMQYPKHRIVCSVTTGTGYALARKQLANTALVIPSPLDMRLTVAAFVKAVRPRIYIAVETELWPNLFNRLAKNNVPLAIVNGRISDKSIGRYRAVKSFLTGVLNNVGVFCMQSTIDAQRIIDLGADPKRVHVVGNIKFEDDTLQGGPETGPGMFKAGEHVLVAGSTHPGEEEMVLDVYKKIQDIGQAWRLVIVPRHVERAGDVMALLRRKGIEGRLFSQVMRGENLRDGDVLVVDAIGHLRALYTQASLVFMGKSFRVGGGQNIIEPAFFGKAVIVGPMMENFRDVLARFKEEDAIVQVNSEEEFSDAVLALVRDEPRRLAMGKRAKAAVDQNKGAVQKTLACIGQMAGLK